MQVTRLTVVVAWAAAGVALALASPWIFQTYWVLGFLPWIAYWLVGLCLLLFQVVTFAEAPRRSAVSLAGIVATVAGLTFGGGELRWAGDMALLAWRLPAYRQLVAQAVAGTVPESGMHAGQGYRIEPGPPMRLAIHAEWGGSDNWSAYVYDPTGAVDAARGWRRDARGHAVVGTPPEVRELFGGDLVFCRRLFGPWRKCAFT